MVLLHEKLRRREDGVDQIGRAPQRPAFPGPRDHVVEAGARQDRTDVPAERPVARQVVLEIGADRVLVGDAEMVRLDAALDEDLPVRRPFPGVLVDDLQASGVEPGEVRGQPGEETVDIGRIAGVGGDPDPAMGLGAAQPLQAERALVDAGKPGLAMRDGLQRAAVVEGPAVIGADEALAATALRVDQPGAAMAADVEEGVHRPLAVAGEQQRQSAIAPGQESVGLCQLARMRDDRGQSAKQRIAFPREPLRAGVARHGRGRDGIVEIKRVRLAQPGKLLEQFDFGRAVHRRIPVGLRQADWYRAIGRNRNPFRRR